MSDQQIIDHITMMGCSGKVPEATVASSTTAVGAALSREIVSARTGIAAREAGPEAAAARKIIYASPGNNTGAEAGPVRNDATAAGPAAANRSRAITHRAEHSTERTGSSPRGVGQETAVVAVANPAEIRPCGHAWKLVSSCRRINLVGASSTSSRNTTFAELISLTCLTTSWFSLEWTK